MTAQAIELPQELRDLEPAVRRLLTRAMRMQRRGLWAGIGTNGRAKCVKQIDVMVACAHEIATDKKLQTKLRDRGLLDAGWRSLWEAVGTHVRERDAKKR